MKRVAEWVREVTVINRQRFRPIQGRAVEQAVQVILNQLGIEFQLGVELVGVRAMARANSQFLGHTGSTDVITFDYGSTPRRLHGDLLISVPDAWRQAVEFKTTGESELLRYLIHGILHLQGFDDQTPLERRRMKRRENQWMSRHADLSFSFLPKARARRIGGRG